MNLIKKISSLFIIALLVGSCADEPLPFEVFEDLEKGAFARLLETNNAPWFLTDVDNAVHTFTVEFYDENDGQNVSSFDWTVRRRSGTVTSDPVPMKSVAASNFGTDATSGLPTASFSFSLTEAASALGLTIGDVIVADEFIFDGTVVLNDGRTFGPDNTGPSIQGGGGFDGYFRFTKNVTCPSDLSGTYDAVAVGTSTDPCCPDETTTMIEVTLTDKGGGIYEMSDWSGGLYFEWYEVYGIAVDDAIGDVQDVCENFSFVIDTEPFDRSLEATGTVDAATGVITYTWLNGWDDTGTVTLTPQ